MLTQSNVLFKYQEEDADSIDYISTGMKNLKSQANQFRKSGQKIILKAKMYFTALNMAVLSTQLVLQKRFSLDEE